MRVIRYLFYLLPWFLSALLFKTDTVFYKGLNKPIFAPPPILFAIIWLILYILIAISIYKIYNDNNYKNTKEYNKALLINYFSNQIFSFLFFTIKSPFLALIDTIIVLISSLFLYYETKSLDKKSSKLLIPYIIWNIFATILITFVFFMNIEL